MVINPLRNKMCRGPVIVMTLLALLASASFESKQLVAQDDAEVDDYASDDQTLYFDVGDRSRGWTDLKGTTYYIPGLTYPPDTLKFLHSSVVNSTDLQNCASCHQTTSANELGDSVAYGFHLRTADAVLRRAVKLGPEEGVVVQEVTPDSSAAMAGFETADILITANGKPIGRAADVRSLLSDEETESVEFELLRAGEKVSISFPVVQFRDEVVYRLLIGVHFTEIESAMRSQLGLDADQGIIVDDLLADYPAVKAGVEVHDVFIKAGNQSVGTTDDIARALREAKGEVVRFTVVREAKRLEIDIKPKRERRQRSAGNAAVHWPAFTALADSNNLPSAAMEYLLEDSTTPQPAWRVTNIEQRDDSISEKLDEILRRLKALEALGK